MKAEIERLRGKTLTEQVNIPVEVELKNRFKKLKTEKRINTAAEARKMLWLLVERLEAAS